MTATRVCAAAIVAALVMLYGAYLVSQLTPQAAFWNTHPLFATRSWTWTRWTTGVVVGYGDESSPPQTQLLMLPPPPLDDLERFASTFALGAHGEFQTSGSSTSVFVTESQTPALGLSSVAARLWTIADGHHVITHTARAVTTSSARTPDARALAHHWLATTPAGTASVLIFQAHADDIPSHIAPLLNRYRRTVVDLSYAPPSMSVSSTTSAASLLTKRKARLHALFGTGFVDVASRIQLRVFTSDGRSNNASVDCVPEWYAHWKRMLAATAVVAISPSFTDEGTSGRTTQDVVIVRCAWYLKSGNGIDDHHSLLPAGGCEIALVPAAGDRTREQQPMISVVLSSVYFHATSFAAQLELDDTQHAKLEFLRQSLSEAVRIAGVLRVARIVALEWSPDMDFVFDHLLERILQRDPRHRVILLDADRSLSVYATCLQPPPLDAQGRASIYLSPAVFLR